MSDETANDIIDRDEAPSFSAGRRFGFGFNVLVAIAAFLAIVVMVNYVASRHFKRFPLGRRAAQTLSPQTLGVLDSLTNDVRVVVVFDREEPLYPLVSASLTEYHHASPHIRLEYIDYVRDPDGAAKLKQQYHLNHLSDKDLVLFDSGGKVRTVYQRELSDYDYSGLLAGTTNEVKRTVFRGEMLFSAAILSVTDPRQVKAYYLMGHGEHKPQDESGLDGYARFISLLNEKNIAVAGATLFGTNEVPADCDVLIIAGPTDLFGKSETDKLEKYLSHGGRAFILLNPAAQGTGLERMLANWSVAIGNNYVFDSQTTVNRADLLAGYFSGHPTVRGLLGTRGLHLSTPRTVEKLTTAGAAADLAKVEELVRTSEAGVAITDIRNGVAYSNPRDRRGQLSLAVAVEKGGLKDVSGDRGATRLVVVGDSAFLGNAKIDSSANRDFASLAINWLLDRPMLLKGLGPRAVTEYRLNLTHQQMVRLRLILLGAIPGGVLLLGVLVWWRRRS